MRMLLNVMFPTEPFNALVRDGKAGEVLQKIMRSSSPRRSISPKRTA
jgi:hypothetical protein